jgi:hypothetical protein
MLRAIRVSGDLLEPVASQSRSAPTRTLLIGYDNGHYFDDFFKAAIEAISFQERWSQIREARSEKHVSRLRDTNSAAILSRRRAFQTRGLFTSARRKLTGTSAITGYRTTRVSAIQALSYNDGPVDVEAFGVPFHCQPGESPSA